MGHTQTNIKLIEYFDERFYKVTIPKNKEEDERIEYYPSVTTKLSAISKPGLASWRGDVGNREADYRMFEASWRGKRIHDAWNKYCCGVAITYKLDEQPDCEYLNMQYQDEYLNILKLVQFCDVVKPEILLTEETVYCHEHKEAGTVDNVLSIKEGEYLVNGSKPLKLPAGNYVVDLKTGKSVFDDAYMQIAAYAHMLETMDKYGIIGGLILHTGATTRTGIPGLAVKYRTKEEIMTDYEDFRAVAKIWARNNKNAMPKTFEFPNIVQLKEEK